MNLFTNKTQTLVFIPQKNTLFISINSYHIPNEFINYLYMYLNYNLVYINHNE